MVEVNNGLEFTKEVFMAIRRDGELVAVELQNGGIHRYSVKEATVVETEEIFGTNKVINLPKMV
jgi:hypothetical protein